MRRLNDDDGATAVFVVVVIVVLIGMAAMVVDIGALWWERRQLQNGADAGSLAVAQSCAAGDCAGYLTQAQTYADDNSNDGASNVQEVCGSTDAGLPACSDPPATTPAGQGWVRVGTQTGSDAGPGLVPPFLAQALVPGYDGSTVHASAIANWGAPSGITGGLPLTFSECEWLAATEDGTRYAPYTDLVAHTWPTDADGVSLERTIYLQNPSAPETCNPEPNGADLPGGFGWLEADDSCEATTTTGWFNDDPGVSVNKDCKDVLDALVDQLIFLPVFDAVNGLNGNNGQYKLAGYAAFFLTGYNFPGVSHDSLVTGATPCKGDDKCISGFFTQGLVPQGGSVGNGPSMGATIVGLAP
jgi:hypothetical protein